MRNKKLYIIFLILFLLIIGVIGGGLYMLDYSLVPENRGKNEKESWNYINNTYPFITPWLDSLDVHHALRDTFIVNEEGIRLHAYYAMAPKPTSRSAVIVHGYTDNAIRMMMIGYLYNYNLRYNILLPDLQYSGQSEGNAILMGWKDRLDVMRWIDVARSVFGGKADSSRIVVHGISMGGATTMCVSGEKLPSNVKCFVEDCGYTSVWDEFSMQLKEQFHLPNFPILYIASYLCQLKYGWNFKEASPLKAVTQCHLPMLFIHGSNDTYVPTWMVYELYKAKPGIKELWITPGVEHAQSYKVFPKEYEKRVFAFVNKYIQ